MVSVVLVAALVASGVPTLALAVAAVALAIALAIAILSRLSWIRWRLHGGVLGSGALGLVSGSPALVSGWPGLVSRCPGLLGIPGLLGFLETQKIMALRSFELGLGKTNLSPEMVHEVHHFLGSGDLLVQQGGLLVYPGLEVWGRFLSLVGFELELLQVLADIGIVTGLVTGAGQVHVLV